MARYKSFYFETDRFYSAYVVVGANFEIDDSSYDEQAGTVKVRYEVKFYNGDLVWHTCKNTKLVINDFQRVYPDSTTIISSDKLLFSGTATIPYDEYGNCTLNMYLETERGNGGTVSGTRTEVLDSFDYSSNFSAPNGTLGIESTLQIAKTKNYVKDTITYACGTATGEVVNKTTSSAVSFTPPLTLKEQGEIGRSVAITYTLKSYINDTQVGEAKTKTVQVLVPDLGSTLSIEGLALGSTSVLNVDRSKSYLRETISYSCGTVTDVVISEKDEETKIDFPVPLSLALQNTTGTNVNITFKIQTFISDEEDAFLYDTKNVTKSFLIPASVKPSITSFTIAEAVDSIAEQFSVYVNKKSRIAFSSSAEGIYGSSIRAYEVVIANQGFTTSSGETATIEGTVGTNIAKLIVTDTRGRTATETIEYTVAEYEVPKIFSLIANRTTDGTTIDDSGQLLRLSANYNASSVNDENTVDVTIGWRLAGTTGNFIPLTSSIPADTYSYNSFEVFNKIGDPVFDSGNSYEIQVTVTDFFTSISENVFLTMGGMAGGTAFNFVNARGESLPLSSNNYFYLIGIDGLTQANTDISSLSFGNADGDIVNNVVTQPRTLTMTLKIKEGVNVKEAKSSILQKVKLKQVGTIEWYEASRHMTISGTVESIEMPRYEQGIAMQINLHCSSPYWEDYNDTVTSNTTLQNEGDVETGLIFTLTATGTVTNPTITTDNGDVFGVGYGTGSKKLTLSSGDILTIDTRQGKKSVKLNTTTNLIAFVKPQSVWHQLQTGENEFVFDNGINPSITYKQRYI